MMHEERLESDEGLAMLRDARGQSPVELLQGGAMGRPTAPVDQIVDGLRLEQVDAAVRPGSTRELPGLRLPAPRTEQRVEHERRCDRPPVSRELDDVLSGVGVRRDEAGDESLVEGLSGVRIPERDESRDPRGRIPVVLRKKCSDDLERARPAHADDGDRAGARAGRAGDDGVDLDRHVRITLPGASAGGSPTGAASRSCPIPSTRRRPTRST